jgi:hypothetical protein
MKVDIKNPSKQRLTPGLVVFLVFASCISIAFFVVFLLQDKPTAQDSCTSYCLSKDKRGVLVNQIPPERTVGMRGRGPQVCECK